jgi:DNA-binding MarR family transcriptional regulator
MFLLKDLPSYAVLERFDEHYGPVDPDAVSLFLTVLRCGSELLTDLDEFLSAFGLTHGRWITLILLRREPDRRARPSSLAEKQGVRRATMTGLLQNLERSGLIDRAADPGDGRGALVRLSSSGERLLEEVMPPYYQHVRTLMEGLQPSEMRAATRVLHRVLSAISKEGDLT